VSGGSSLTFTAATWSTPQTVTLAAADDDDVANGGATITVSASGLTSVDVTAAEVDDDTQSLVVDPLIVSVPEGDQSTFTVRLAYRPAGDTAVTVARTAGDSDLSVAVGASLLFSTTNWNVAQVVAVAAATDVDTDNGVATIEVAAADMAVVAVNVSEVEATGPTTPGGSGGGGGGGGGCGAGALALVLLALGLRRRQ
jgi:cellulose 1,4-beta-cellobiosidase